VSPARVDTAEIPGWQGQAIAALLPALQAWFPAAPRVGVTGSVATASVDPLSDLDLVVVSDELPDAFGDLTMAAAAGPVWSIDRQEGDGARTLRLVYTDGRRIDLLLRTMNADLPAPLLWLDIDALAPSVPVLFPSQMGRDPARAEVLAVRHVAALAAAKLGRGDLLIGAHLCLDVARQALVVSMLLRDLESGRTHHHHGGRRDRDVLQVSKALSDLPAEAAAEDWIDLLLRLIVAFDSAAGALWPDYEADWQGLDAIVVAARTALADPSE